MGNAIGKLAVNAVKGTEATESLAGKIFVIPYYQRGYRWTANEAKRLFVDLLEFAKNSETEYCLQPIILQQVKKQDNWCNFPESDGKDILRVVDGQQRLTTISILLNELNVAKDWDIYYIPERNTLSGLLTTKNFPPSVNDHFRNVVKKAFDECEDNEKETIKKLFLPDSLKTVSFLRYDIPGDNKEDPEGHNAFLRLNDGKTPLTSSELTRALYMVNGSGLSLQERMEISKEWEIIENTLRNEQFWLMFNSKGLSNTPTRIDLLFALVMDVSLENAKANTRIVFEKMDENFMGDKKSDLKMIWLDVLRCFWWMQSCYADVEVFNYLGWINEFTDNSAKTIYDNWRSYPKPEDFKKCIIGIIKRKYEGKSLNEFNYGCEKMELRALFVLLNILDCNNSKERFRFDLYKNESWDIEHIDSLTLNELTNEQDQGEWLISSYNELSEEEKEEFKKEFSDFDIDKCTHTSLDDFTKKAEKIRKLLQGNQEASSDNQENFDENALGNLALLNASINRSYKNALFPAKRNVIKEFIVSGKCYIPPCTAKVFMKFYTESPSKITYWLKADFDGYFNTMKNHFDAFIRLQTELEENAGKKDSAEQAQKNENLSAEGADHQISDDNKKTSSDNKETSSDAINFSDFMLKYGVVIPKIQRLYVQGRPDSYGHKCLSSFAAHLVESVTNNKDSLLDFIYGIEDEKVFYPLDGQQRLTTLLLLAWLCGGTKKEWSFRYESRRATECFIKELLCHTPPELKKPDKYDERMANDKKSNTSQGYLPLCSDFIKKSDWFLSIWEEDAGIAGMLEMLDSLYCKLLDSGKQKFDFSKIKFFVNYLDASKASYDQIFLKMNSRGKALTSWESIKAILDKNVPPSCAKWQENLNNTWQEWLWGKLNDIEQVDSKMLSVVELALECAGYTEKAKDNTFQLAQWLEREDNKPHKEEFYSICSIFFSALNSKIEVPPPAWGGASCPDFTQDSPEEFYKPLLAYYAANESTNGDWMRVVWNIVENAEINRRNFPAACKLIKALSEHANNILSVLAGNNKLESQFACEQVAEERAKAKQILSSHGNTDWKSSIVDAERRAFFKGAIRFLFTNENGEVDWAQFKSKSSATEQLFDNNGLRAEQYPNANKKLLSYCTDWSQLKRQYLFGSSAGNWKQILLNRNFITPVHQLLTVSFPQQDIAGDYKDEIRLLQNDVIWDFIRKSEAQDSYQLEWRDNACCLWLKNYPSWTLRLRENSLLNSFMQQIPENIELRGERERERDIAIEVSGKIIFKNENAFLKFIYEKDGRKYYFIWQHWGWIDLCDEDFKPKGNGKSFEAQSIGPSFCADKFKNELEKVIGT